MCEEALETSASFFGGEVNHAKRYRLGRRLSAATRHVLLLTATPHSGKEEDFQLFLALLDADRLEGRFRQGVPAVDVSDPMRRVTKEALRAFDGTPRLPGHLGHTVPCRLCSVAGRRKRAAEACGHHARGQRGPGNARPGAGPAGQGVLAGCSWDLTVINKYG